MSIFLVEFDQRFGMFRDEGDGQHDEGLALAPRAPDLIIGRGSDPFERPHPALIAGDPVETLDPEPRDDRGAALLDLGLIGIAPIDHLFRQAVSGEENADTLDAARLADGGAKERCITGNEALFGGVAADCPCRHGKPGACGRLLPVAQGGLGRRRRILRIKRQKHDFIGSPGLRGGSGLPREGMPVAHGDEAAIFGLAVG